MMNDIFTPKKKPQIKKILSKQKIIIDYREKNSLVPSELVNQNLQIEFKQLKVGDYLVKDNVIERKTVKDFIYSMIDKRLFNQLKEIKQYPNYFLIIEGNFNTVKTKINSNSIRGLILSISLNYKVPIIFTKNENETAIYISLLARKKTKELSLNPSKNTFSPNQQLQYVLESFPNIGPKTSKKLLYEFQNLLLIFNSSEEQLKPFLGKNSWKFKEILKRKYLNQSSSKKFGKSKGFSR